MGFRKRLSAPLISSLIHAFMHPSSSSASSKKSSLQLASTEDTADSAEEGGSLGDSKHKGLCLSSRCLTPRKINGSQLSVGLCS